MTEQADRKPKVHAVWIVVLLVLAAVALWVNYGPTSKPSASDLPPLPEPVIGNLDASIQGAIREALEAARRSPLDAGLNKMLGMIFHANALLPEAEVCYRRAAQLAPDEFDSAYLLARVNFQAGDHSQALENCRRAGEINAGYVPLEVLRGEVHWQRDELKAAEEVFAEIVRTHPLVPAGHYWLGRVYGRQGRSDEAVKRFRRAITLSPGNKEVLYGLGMALRDAGQSDEAARQMRAFERAGSRPLYNDPIADQLMGYRTGPEAAFQRGLRLGEAGRMEEAIAAYQEAIQLDPNFAEAHQNLGVAYLGMGQYAESVEALTRAVKANPNLPQARTNLATALARSGRVEEAETVFRQAIELDPNNPAVYNDFGNTLANVGRFADAVACYKDAIRVAPGDLPPRINLGIALHNLGKWDEAVASYEEALKLSEGNEQATELLGQVLVAAGRSLEAVTLLETAIRKGSDHPALHLGLANAYAAAGRFGEAEVKFQQVLSMAPEAGQAVADYYAMLESQRAYDKAISLLRQAQAAMPNDGSIADRLAWLLATCPVEQLRNGAEAVRLAEEICRQTEYRFAEPMLTLAAAYAEVGRFDDASQTAKRALALASSVQDADLVERLQAALEQFEDSKPFRLAL